MAYEFKKLSDVEVVAEPTESANVLIEEDGVIKKVPKSTVGGSSSGGGNERTMFFSIENSGVWNVSAPDGLYEKLQNMFDNKACIDIIVYVFNSDRNDFTRLVSDCISKNGDNFEAWFDVYHLIVYNNGQMDLFYDD